MSSESLTQKWLRQNVQSYSQKDRVFADIDSLLGRFSTLRPKSDIYTYDDGRTQLLLCIHGLLPIAFRQASYNIPIAIWITKEYPRQPPIAYVVPTNDMLVRAGKYIDVSGRCHIEYIQHWEKKSEGCNLLSLLEAMQDQFSHEPPVYAKPKNTETVTQTPSPNQQGRSPPMPPGHTTLPGSQSTSSDDRPALPPKPGLSAIPLSPPSIPTSPSGSIHPLPIAQTPALASRPPPSLPASEPHPSRHETVPIPANYHPHNRNISAGNIPGPAPMLREENTMDVNPRWSIPPPQPAPTYQNYVRAYSSPLPPPAPPLPPPPPPPPPPHPPQRQSAIAVPNLLDEETPDETQLSQTPFPKTQLPPRPPNPELLRLHAQVHDRLTSELASLSQAMTLDAERLRSHQIDLLSGEPAIRDEMARLEAVRDVCRTVAVRMSGTVEQAEKNIADLRRKGDPEVDELVCSTTIVHNQLVNLVAEDNAIEDTIYHLHRALNTGRVDLERFLRTTRVLAEEQFMKRALIEKIQAGIPMGMYTNSSWP